MSKKNEGWDEQDLSFADAVEWDAKGQEVVGTLFSIEEAGNLGSRLMVLKDDKGEKIGVWEAAVLKKFFDRMEAALAENQGMAIKIVYQGKEKLKSGRTGHKFDVFTRPA